MMSWVAKDLRYAFKRLSLMCLAGSILSSKTSLCFIACILSCTSLQGYVERCYIKVTRRASSRGHVLRGAAMVSGPPEHH